MGHDMAFVAEPLVISYEWAHLLGEGTAHALICGCPTLGSLPVPTHRVHGKTGSIPV